MALNLRPPSQGIGSTEDKLRNLYSYLFQMTEELNQAISNVENSSRDTLYRAVSGGGSGGKNKVPQTTAEAYQQLKSLIIKTATEVTSSMRKIVTEMSAEYRAQSEFGTYEEYLNNRITQSAEGYVLEWDAQQGISTGVADFKEYKADSDVYMKIGIVGYNEDGTAEAGVVVGRELQKVTVNGKEILISENVYSLLRADGLSLWQNGAKLTEVSLSGFFGEKAYIDEVTTDLIQSKEKGAQLALNEGLLEGLADNINLEANESIKLAVKDDLEGLESSIETLNNEIELSVKNDIKNLNSSIKQTDDKISLLVEDGSTASNIQLTQGAIQAISDEIVLTTAKELESESGTVIINDDGVAMTGGEISMVTRTDGAATGAVVINEDGIVAAGTKIDLVAEDGDEFVNISKDGISASSMSAENVMPRYNGPQTLTVDSTATPSESVFRSINSALSTLSGRYIPYTVTINIAAKHVEYGVVRLQGAIGGAWIQIYGDSTGPAKIVGTLQLYYDTCPVTIKYLNVDVAQGGVGVDIQSCMNVTIQNSVLTGTKVNNVGTGNGIKVQRNATVYAGVCDAYGFLNSFVATDGGVLCVNGCNFDSQVEAKRATMYVSYSKIYNVASWNPALTAGQVLTYSNTTYTSGGSTTTPEKAPTTDTVAAIGTDSWYSRHSRWYSDDDLVRQGYTEYNQTWSGCVWFDMSAFKGTTIKSAALTFKRVSGKGIGHPIKVKVYALALAYSGHTSYNPNNYALYGQEIGEVNWGETVTYDLKGSLMSAIATSGVAGFMFKSDDTTLHGDKNYSDNYAIFESKLDNKDVLGLTVSYV